MFANHNIVRDLDQVVDLGATLNPGPAEKLRDQWCNWPNFNVIVDLDNANLRDLYMVSQLILSKAKPVTANDRPTVNDDPITHPTAVKQRDMGVKHAMRANFNLTPQIGSPIDSRPFTDPAARPNMNQGTDAGIFPYFHPLAHHCRLMHSERRVAGGSKNSWAARAIARLRLAGNKQRAIQVFHGVRHNQRCCPTIDGQGPVSLMAHKTQFICLSIFQGTQPPTRISGSP